jgi:predicted AlkP superfamily phosphohydrolase/phosphomutase
MDLIHPWSVAGQLPAISGLMSNGYAGQLLSTPNMHSASAWTSILTGLNPGRHGLFVFSDRDFRTGRQEFFTGGDREGDLIGRHIARQGWTSGFLNVPMTYPAEGVDGSFMVSGLDAPELNDLAFYPAELRRELFERFPSYGFSPPQLSELMRAGKVEEATKKWIDLVEVQTAAAEYLIGTRPVDFFMIVYTASDWAGHNLWNRSDQILAVYGCLDRAIQRLLKHADRDTQVYVISDHGMGRHSGASYQLADWLQSHGYMARKSRATPAVSGMRALNKGKNVARALIPTGIKQRIKSTIGGDRVKRLQAVEKDSFYASIDWQKSVAYAEPGRHVININLSGRNGDGLVTEADYSDTCERIIRDLAEWVDSSGTRVVERVVRRDEVYSGPHVHRASDLYVYWNPSADVGEPPAEVRSRGFWWSGDHRQQGLLIASGGVFRKTDSAADVSVYDLVPTMMYAAGLAVPEGLDGRVVEEIFRDEYRSRTPLRFAVGVGAEFRTTGALTEDEERKIEEKLRGLGYL